AFPRVDIDAISESAGRVEPQHPGSRARRWTPSVVRGTSRGLARRSRRSHLFAVRRHEEIPEACRNQYVELLASSWHRRADASVDDTDLGVRWGSRGRGSRYGSPLVRIQWVASARWRATATGEPWSQRWTKCRRAPRSWGICSSRTS